MEEGPGTRSHSSGGARQAVCCGGWVQGVRDGVGGREDPGISRG